VASRLRIAAGRSICTVAPENGGSIVSWTVDNQPMLRTAALGALDPLAMASFPLVPFSNRIGNARFSWEGGGVILPSHPAALPHALHGIGWEREWTVADAGGDLLDLTLDHPGSPAWPWPFRALQQIRITDDSVILTLTATNLADEPAPLAIGHHPYYDAVGARLSFVAKQFFPNARDGLPMDPITPSGDYDFTQPRVVDDSAIDNLYGHWSGTAHIHWLDRPYALTIMACLPHAVLYTPPGEDYFCFEPVPHITNALNRADGDMPVIDPGDSFTAQISFTAVPV
jgi:aldose 1-epimerase